jgi:hypothetical protein
MIGWCGRMKRKGLMMTEWTPRKFHHERPEYLWTQLMAEEYQIENPWPPSVIKLSPEELAELERSFLPEKSIVEDGPGEPSEDGKNDVFGS